MQKNNTTEYAKIPLTQGRTALVDRDMVELLSRHKWCVNYWGYAHSSIGGKNIKMHRLVLGANDPKQHIDHINRDKLDNRRSNLRVCTPAQNIANIALRANNSSGYKGVSYSKARGRFEAKIVLAGKTIHLGRFAKAKDAAAAYNQAATRRHGEFEVLNDVPNWQDVDTKRLRKRALLKKTNKSGYRGVSFSHRAGKYHAQISFKGNKTHLGYFDDPVEAAQAYDYASSKFWGDKALLNFPSNNIAKAIREQE